MCVRAARVFADKLPTEGASYQTKRERALGLCGGDLAARSAGCRLGAGADQ